MQKTGEKSKFSIRKGGGMGYLRLIFETLMDQKQTMTNTMERRFRRMFFDYNERREMQMEQLEKAEQRNTFASKLKKIFSRL